MIDLTAIEIQNLTAVELRKLGGQAGIKGASKGKKEFLMGTLMEIRHEQLREAEAAAAKLEAEAASAALAEAETTPVFTAPARGKCTECGRNEDFRGSGLCEADRTHGEWENAHSDENHGKGREIEGCWICYPELDGRKARREGRSRAGMVIVARGTEIHKSATFKAAAEATGWVVTMMSETYELPEGAEGEGTRYYATATRGDDSISLAWDGRAYDYAASSAQLGGKARKIRNLKEALRVL
jgi:hypothetical protein